MHFKRDPWWVGEVTNDEDRSLHAETSELDGMLNLLVRNHDAAIGQKRLTIMAVIDQVRLRTCGSCLHLSLKLENLFEEKRYDE